jgi:hypothetical protein
MELFTPTVAALCFNLAWNAIWLMLIICFIEAAVRRAVADAGFRDTVATAIATTSDRLTKEERRGLEARIKEEKERVKGLMADYRAVATENKRLKELLAVH